MEKIVTIVGARPQFVKAAVLSRIIAKNDDFKEVIIHTGQHYDSNMSEVFFTEMEIPKPKYNLNINELGHGAMTGRMLEEIEKILLVEKPKIVIVYGDTNSTLSGALAAKKLHIKVVHIEAGLRSFNMQMPEEINRILTDRISNLLLCPTDTSLENLRREGFDNLDNIVVKCGDIMKDAVEFYGEKSKLKTSIIEDLGIKNNEFVLATIHREENTNDLERFKSIFEGLEIIAQDTKVVIPLHPRSKNILDKYSLSYNLLFIPPASYFEMLELLKNCMMVITDSGGLQKEAFFNKKHCIIARQETEWVELVTHNIAVLVGSNQQKMIQAFNNYKNSNQNFSIDLYGHRVGQAMYEQVKKIS